MPEINGVFDKFSNLSQISAAALVLWLPKTFDTKIIENYLGNKLLYPSSVPTSQREELIDLAILREAIKLSPDKYFDANSNKIYIPAEISNYFLNMTKVAWAFIDVFVKNPFTTIVNRGNVVKNAGTVLKLDVNNPKGVVDIWIKNQGKKYQVKVGSLTVIPVNLPKVDIKFASSSATLAGQASLEVEIAGGILGVVIDGRI